MKILFLIVLALSTHSFAQTRGLTWGVTSALQPSGHVNVGCHGLPATSGVDRSPSCDPYKGDTSCDEIRPVLCIQKNGANAPQGLAMDQYNQWASGEVRGTDPIEGNKLSSLEAANAYCAEYFGAGWRMAEFHDGWGWGFWAQGKLSNAERFWVHINDQPGNCWNGGSGVPGPKTPVKPIEPNTNIPSFLF